MVKKEIEQWFLRITDYAEQLLEDLKEIEAGWPEKVLKRQRDWIGKSVGAYVDFAIEGSEKTVRVFTTRIDTIYGANAVVLAAEHPLVAELMEDSPLKVNVALFVERVRAERDRATEPGAEEEKEGINTGVMAINPFSGERVQVWIANYVLMEYGSGAVMSVPAHDERDFEFAKKYTLPIRQVIAAVTHAEEPRGSDVQLGVDQSMSMTSATTVYGVLINSGDWSGKFSDVAIKEMTAFAKDKGFRRSRGHVSHTRLGNLAAEVLGRAHSDCLLREVRHCSRAGKRFADHITCSSRIHWLRRVAARGCRRVRKYSLSEMRRPCSA